MIYDGIAHTYGDDVDTDVILPGPYMNLEAPADLARHALEGLDPGFTQRVTQGDILVVGRNFGCGSSREHAPIALKAAGISCIVAKSYARIFFRNAINVGLPIVIAPDAVDHIAGGDHVSVDTVHCRIRVGSSTYDSVPFAPFIQVLIDEGGLEPFVRRRLASREA
jgi:3-isopropylmalate/(R)-2-methylmalate dehydratase small subunit